ncbi:hypothetical protein A4X06_0g8849 [Tilletia controversa]|uniref:Uncharacterized protein n=1 Tax=Tilletia controversa TaxID=13291 RepID=A0A8X7SSS9_9BASI|nr:hypothetical protein A4X06_0g8849 [Tilletia controversa]
MSPSRARRARHDTPIAPKNGPGRLDHGQERPKFTVDTIVDTKPGLPPNTRSTIAMQHPRYPGIQLSFTDAGADGGTPMLSPSSSSQTAISSSHTSPAHKQHRTKTPLRLYLKKDQVARIGIPLPSTAGDDQHRPVLHHHKPCSQRCPFARPHHQQGYPYTYSPTRDPYFSDDRPVPLLATHNINTHKPTTPLSAAPVQPPSRPDLALRKPARSKRPATSFQLRWGITKSDHIPQNTQGRNPLDQVG